jgi:hypothetical protein
VRNLEKIKAIFKKIGLPEYDLYNLPTSEKTFPDGCHYRIEISGIERPSTLEALIDEMERRDVPVHRIISTVMGSTFLTDDEMAEFKKLAKEKKLEVIITPGPRAFWEIGRQIITSEGAFSGLRFRGMQGLVHAVYDIKRSIEFGFRGFLVVDEGLLWSLNEMKKIGEIPKDIIFKVSIFAGHANPAGAKLLEKLGATTFNPVADLTLPMISAIREAINLPLDLHIYLFDSFGGFNRIYEGPEMARIASPCYFKIEPGTSVSTLYKQYSSPDTLSFLAREKVKYAENLIQIIDRNYPGVKLSELGAPDLAIPK